MTDDKFKINDETKGKPEGDDGMGSTAMPDLSTDFGPVEESLEIDSGVVLQNIGPYRLIRKIGQGGMGSVYEALQTDPVKRHVALKVISIGREIHSQFVARFEAERQALALMDHPCIAKILDGGETENRSPYYVMELVNGVPLTEFCDEHSLSIKQRLTLFQEICKAVQHAHQKGIIHRDLEPVPLLNHFD